MGKRGKREGTIRKRADGRYEGRVLLGYRDGKPVRPSFYGDTKEDVQRQLREAVSAFERGTFVAASSQTVGEYLDQWLEHVAKPTIRAKSHRSYAQLIRLHLKPGLGSHRVQKLTPQQVQAFLFERHANGLSARTVQYLKAVLRRALSQAVKWQIVTRNVATLADAPRVERTEIRPLTMKEAKAFLAAVRGHRLEALFSVALTVGLR
jgi:site-specific recombinase XerC